MSPRALIAEDEPLLAVSLQAALAEAWPELQIVAVVANGPAAIEAAEREQPDIVFLDIRMPGASGLRSRRISPIASAKRCRRSYSLPRTTSMR